MGKDRKLATSAAAIAASTTFVSTDTCNWISGVMRMAAIPANAEPSAQLVAAMKSGENPRLDAARWFSATAVVARPNFVYR